MRDRPVRLKRIMAGQFLDLEGTAKAIDGPEGSTLLAERNRVAIDVLAKQISAGKKRLAIFYGAAHMPDMEERLAEKFALQPVGSIWLEAWNLRLSEAKDAPAAAVGE